MPNQGEQIHARTQERDAMFGRMAQFGPTFRQSALMAMDGHPLTFEGPRTIELDPQDGTSLFVDGRPYLMEGAEPGVILTARPGSVLEAVGGGEVRSVIEDVLRTYTNIGPAGATPEHQWRAAEHFRPFHAIEALTQAMEKLVRDRIRVATRTAADV